MSYSSNSIEVENKTTQEKSFETKYYRKSRISAGFSYLPNSTSHDPNLSLQALGLLSHIFSNSEDWKIIPKYMARSRKFDGVKKIYSAINHLIEQKYAVRLVYREKSKNGQWSKQYFGYHFFDMPASKMDIEKAQEEFEKSHGGKVVYSKKEYREIGFGDDGFGKYGKGDIQQEEEENNKKTTTEPLKDEGEDGATAPVLLPSSSKKAVTFEINQNSLPLFNPSRKYLKGLSDAEIRQVQICYEKSKDVIENPEGWVTVCIKEGWHRETMITDMDLQENFKLATRIMRNFDKLEYNSGYTYFDALSAGVVFTKGGKEVPMPSYRLPNEKFKEILSNKLLVEMKYPDKVFD